MRPHDELERRYRALLRAYPGGYRQHRGEEMLTTLMETARPGQARPDRRDVAELLRGALRERLGMHGAPGLVAGVRIAGPVCLAIATAFSVAIWALNPREPGFAVAAGLWLVAALSYLFVPRALGWSIGVAWLGTVGAAATVGLRPEGPAAVTIPYGQLAQLVYLAELRAQYAVPITCGLIAVLALATVQWRQSRVDRIALAAVVPAAVADTLLLSFGGLDFRLNWTNAVRLLPLALLAAGTVVAVVRRSTALLWAGLLLLVPSPLISAFGPLDLAQLRASDAIGPEQFVAVTPMTPFALVSGSALAPVVALGAVVVIAVALADAHRRTAVPRDGRAALATLGALALGMVGGICAFVLAVTAYHGVLVPGDVVALGAPVAAATVVPFLPAPLRRPVLLAALAAVLVTAYNQGATSAASELLVVVVLLLVLAAAQGRADARTVAASAAGAAALTAGLAWLVQGTLRPPLSYLLQGRVVPAVGGVVIAFALWWAPYVLVRAERFRVGAVFAFAAGLLWLALQFGLAGDAPRLIAGILGCVAVVVAMRFVVRRSGPTVASAR